MTMAVVVMRAADGLRQILDVGELAGLRRVGEVRGKLVQLVRRGCVAIRRSCLGGALQLLSDLLRHLRILRRILLLKLLKRAQQLRERGKAAAVLRP